MFAGAVFIKVNCSSRSIWPDFLCITLVIISNYPGVLEIRIFVKIPSHERLGCDLFPVSTVLTEQWRYLFIMKCKLQGSVAVVVLGVDIRFAGKQQLHYGF